MDAGSLQQGMRAHDVGVNEGIRAGYRTVDMTLGGEVEHAFGLEAPKGGRQRLSVADISLQEFVIRQVGDIAEGTQVASVAEGINVEHLMATLTHQGAHQITANEPGTSCHHRPHESSLCQLSYALCNASRDQGHGDADCQSLWSCRW